MKILVNAVEEYPVYDVVLNVSSELEEFGEYSDYYEVEVSIEYAEHIKSVIKEFSKLQGELKDIYNKKYEEDINRKYTGEQASKCVIDILNCMNEPDSRFVYKKEK